MHLPATIQLCKIWWLSLNNVVYIHITFKLGISINFESFLLALLMDFHWLVQVRSQIKLWKGLLYNFINSRIPLDGSKAMVATHLVEVCGLPASLPHTRWMHTCVLQVSGHVEKKGLFPWSPNGFCLTWLLSFFSNLNNC